MNDVVLGDGSLAGRGLYAARAFAAGEVVLTYRLQPLDENDYLALPAGEDLFVHSFGGRRYLYPAPARFQNHSADPSCYEDFDRCRTLALRPIAEGEPITIDAHQETARELATFLDAYRGALADGSVPVLTGLTARNARLWLHGHAAHGSGAVVAALLGSGELSVSEVEWTVGTGRWESLCSAEVEIAGQGRHHMTMLLRIIAGNWQLLYQHIG